MSWGGGLVCDASSLLIAYYKVILQTSYLSLEKLFVLFSWLSMIFMFENYTSKFYSFVYLCRL
jgi:hypothetical protein